MADCLNTYKEERDLGQDKAVQALKEKLICEAWRLLTLLGRGYMPDLDYLMGEAALISMAERGDEELPSGASLQYPLQFYLSGKWDALPDRPH